MTSEHATAAVGQPNQPPSIHEAASGDHPNNSVNSSLRGGDPFTTYPQNQNRQDTPPRDTGVVLLTQPALDYIPQSARGNAEGGYTDNSWRPNMPQNRTGDYQTEVGNGPPLPPSPAGVRLADTQFNLPARPARTRTMSTDPTNRLSGAPPSAHLSHNASRLRTVPDDRGEIFYTEKGARIAKGSIQERLSATIESAQTERDKYASRASATGLALNVAIGLQVLLGSLTTGLSAVATRGGHSSAVATTILGALATLVASYLARARGSNEPELSITRVKDLEHFLRECHNFSDDHADYVGHDYDDKIESLRRRFEELLGNANGERKLSPPGS